MNDYRLVGGLSSVLLLMQFMMNGWMNRWMID